jgi:flagellar biosynthesis protein FlhG
MQEREDEGLDSAPPGVAPGPPEGRRIIAIGGGRGGVGKSLLTVNLGVYLAQLGRDVLITDADVAGSSLHIQLGLERAPLADTEQVESLSIDPLPTVVPGLRILPSAFDLMAASPFRPGRKARWIGRLRGLRADYVLVHLGAGTSPATLDLFLASDVGICVTTPDPSSVDSTYRFLRLLYIRQLRRAVMKERFKLRMLERSLREIGPLPSPLEVVAAIGRHDAALADIATAQLARARARLVVNQTRLRTDLDLGASMQGMIGRYLGLSVEYVGHVEQDDQAWLTARRRRPLLVDSPTAKSARNLERIARRVVALASSAELRGAEPAVPVPERRSTLYDVLGVSRGASDEDVRRAYKRQRELFSPGSLSLVSLIDEAQMREELVRIQEAYDTLLDPVRRRAYDVSAFPESERDDDVGAQRGRDLGPDLLVLQAELAREIHPETEFTGELLRKVRESLAVELADIASRTKIASAHLQALEAETYDRLPAEVYVRGFLHQVARQLKLDPAQVVKTYVRRMREALAARAHG